MVRKQEVDHTIHDQLAMKLCAEALRNPDSGESKVYLKALLQLSMSFSNPSHTRDLHSLTRKLLRNIKDKTGLKLVEQFDTIVQKHLTAPCDPANSAIVDIVTESETAVPAPAPSLSPEARKPRIRQLGSKHGATLLMDAAGVSDAENSQCSDVFFSPQSTSTQSEKKCEKSSSEEIAIEVDTRYI